MGIDSRTSSEGVHSYVRVHVQGGPEGVPFGEAVAICCRVHRFSCGHDHGLGGAYIWPFSVKEVPVASFYESTVAKSASDTPAPAAGNHYPELRKTPGILNWGTQQIAAGRRLLPKRARSLLRRCKTQFAQLTTLRRPRNMEENRSYPP